MFPQIFFPFSRKRVQNVRLKKPFFGLNHFPQPPRNFFAGLKTSNLLTGKKTVVFHFFSRGAP